jgi:hypothetical protein
MDRRPERRLRKLRLATKIADRLNAGTSKQAKNALRLATEKPGVAWVPDGKGGIKPGGYTRSTITATRPYGQATLWWHSKSRGFRVKVDPMVKARTERRLLLDAFAKVGSDAVARCGACGLYYARHDARQKYCSTTCSDRERQRTRRSRARARTPEARAAYAASEARQAAARQLRADRLAAAPYTADQVAAVRDAQARREQARLRNES